MKKGLTTLFVCAIAIASAQTVLPTKKITVFKNATAMVVKEGTVPVKDGVVKLPIPTQTRFGTYFIGSGKDNSVKNMVFKTDTLKKKAVANAIWQYIAGNLNKPVTIYYTPTQGIDKSASGKITDYNLYSGMMRFTTDAGKNMIMHVGNIYDVEFKEEPSASYMADSIQRIMLLRPDKAADNINLQQIHVTGGINWIPSYYLRLKDDKTARLEMKALVENYAEDLKETETELVDL